MYIVHTAVVVAGGGVWAVGGLCGRITKELSTKSETSEIRPHVLVGSRFGPQSAATAQASHALNTARSCEPASPQVAETTLCTPRCLPSHI